MGNKKPAPGLARVGVKDSFWKSVELCEDVSYLVITAGLSMALPRICKSKLCSGRSTCRPGTSPATLGSADEGSVGICSRRQPRPLLFQPRQPVADLCERFD